MVGCCRRRCPRRRSSPPGRAGSWPEIFWSLVGLAIFLGFVAAVFVLPIVAFIRSRRVVALGPAPRRIGRGGAPTAAPGAAQARGRGRRPRGRAGAGGRGAGRSRDVAGGPAGRAAAPARPAVPSAGRRQPRRLDRPARPRLGGCRAAAVRHRLLPQVRLRERLDRPARPRQPSASSPGPPSASPAGSSTAAATASVSQMLTAAGIVLLYLATFASFGYYHLMPRDRAAIFLVLLVAEAAALAVVYDAVSHRADGRRRRPAHADPAAHRPRPVPQPVRLPRRPRPRRGRRWPCSGRGASSPPSPWPARKGSSGCGGTRTITPKSWKRRCSSRPSSSPCSCSTIRPRLRRPPARGRHRGAGADGPQRLPVRAGRLRPAARRLPNLAGHRGGRPGHRLHGPGLAGAAPPAGRHLAAARRGGDRRWASWRRLPAPGVGRVDRPGLGGRGGGAERLRPAPPLRPAARLGAALLVLAAGRLLLVDTVGLDRTEPFVPVFNELRPAGAGRWRRACCSRPPPRAASCEGRATSITWPASRRGWRACCWSGWCCRSTRTSSSSTLPSYGSDTEHLERVARTSLSVLWPVYAALVLAGRLQARQRRPALDGAGAVRADPGQGGLRGHGGAAGVLSRGGVLRPGGHHGGGGVGLPEDRAPAPRRTGEAGHETA